MDKRKVLRFRREPRHSGLAGVCQGQRGFELYYGDECVGRVAAIDKFKGDQWYWYSFEANTCYKPDDLEMAKASCKAYAKAWIANHPQGEI